MYFVLFSFTIRPNCNEMFLFFLKVSIIVCSVPAVINIPSAYVEYCFKPLSSSCFKISSITILNRVDHNGSPCFTPVVISNFSV